MTDDRSYAIASLDTPIGLLRLAACDHGLSHVLFAADKRRLPEAQEITPAMHNHLTAARDALTAYFAGEHAPFGDVALAPSGTVFQQKVWAALRPIPFGETRSYRDIAMAIGNPKAVRAVGLANGKNPLPVTVPCHRVIGSNGSLTGFAGGLPMKRWLLEFEGALRSRAPQQSAFSLEPPAL